MVCDGTNQKNKPFEDIFNKIKEKEFDILLTVGAGNIDTLYDPICEWLSGNKD